MGAYDSFDAGLRQFARRVKHMDADRPEVAGQIMTKAVHTAADTHIVQLVGLLSDSGLHHIPIVDGEDRLAGMVTQSDLIGALYCGRVAETAALA